MTPAEYQGRVLLRARKFDLLADNLMHASLGIATEGGEFTTEVKRLKIYDKEMTPEMVFHMLEELGDTLWYIVLAAHHLGSSLDGIMEMNEVKLQKRYPFGYSAAAAEARIDKGGLSAKES